MSSRKPQVNSQAKQIEKRKKEHLAFCLKTNVQFKNKTTLFEDVFLVHNALPEINRHDVDTSTKFLGHRFSAPCMISGMTGGCKEAFLINKNIARACQKLGLGMGLGSMKAMLVAPELTYTYRVRKVAPDIFLAGNIGANDLERFPLKVLKEAMKVVGADILAVHLNPAQEQVQKEGSTDFAKVLGLINRYSEKIPIYIKEVGHGISERVARKLSQTAIKAIDVAGAGGTSWTAVEYARQGLNDGLYWDWGIPTALSLVWARRACRLPLIASGGIRTGEDGVKALALGADLVGIAGPILRFAAESYESTEQEISRLIKEIRDVMFLLGNCNIEAIKKVKPILVGELKELTSR